MRAILLVIPLGFSFSAAVYAQNYNDPCRIRPQQPGIFGAFTPTQQQIEACEQMQAAVAARQRAEAAQAQAEAAERKQEIDRQQAAAEAAVEARVKRDIAVREQTKKAAEAAQLAAENSPENHCRQPDFARMIISEFNQFKPMKALDEQVVDIEHITTSKYDIVGSDIICHGIFITTGGRRMVGSVEMRKNVAGDPIILWKRER